MVLDRPEKHGILLKADEDPVALRVPRQQHRRILRSETRPLERIVHLAFHLKRLDIEHVVLRRHQKIQIDGQTVSPFQKKRRPQTSLSLNKR